MQCIIGFRDRVLPSKPRSIIALLCFWMQHKDPLPRILDVSAVSRFEQKVYKPPWIYSLPKDKFLSSSLANVSGPKVKRSENPGTDVLLRGSKIIAYVTPNKITFEKLIFTECLSTYVSCHISNQYPFN